jgi:hypothetical protein
LEKNLPPVEVGLNGSILPYVVVRFEAKDSSENRALREILPE